MLRSLLCSGALVVTLGGVASAQAPTTSRTLLLKRSVFDLVGASTDVHAICDGQPPVAVQFQRTAADLAAAVFTGMWYTPAHLRVTCAAR
jgi:hypothetical protein